MGIDLIRSMHYPKHGCLEVVSRKLFLVSLSRQDQTTFDIKNIIIVCTIVFSDRMKIFLTLKHFLKKRFAHGQGMKAFSNM